MGGDFIMEQRTQWKRRLDLTLDQLSVQLKEDLYDNVVVQVVMDWFTNSDSISQLNENIKRRLGEAWPISQRKIERGFSEFQETLKADIIEQKNGGPSGGLNIEEVESAISPAIANVIGSIVAVVSGTIMGGGGMALIETGPVGWIIGAILGALIFFGGKKRIQEGIIEPAIRDRQIPKFFKKAAKTKIATQMSLNAPKFQEDLYQTLKKQSAPLYEALDKLNG